MGMLSKIGKAVSKVSKIGQKVAGGVGAKTAAKVASKIPAGIAGGIGAKVAAKKALAVKGKADKNVQKVNNKVLTSAQKAAQIAKMKKTEAQQQAKVSLPKQAPYKPGEGGRGLPPNKKQEMNPSRPALAGRGPVGPAPAGMTRAGMTSLNATPSMKKGGKTKCMAKGGGIEVRGKTRGRFI